MGIHAQRLYPPANRWRPHERIQREGFLRGAPDQSYFLRRFNYVDHAEEAGFDLPKVPMIFGRWFDSLVVDGTAVPLPKNKGMDWGVELAANIADEVWDVTEDTALDHVLGYTVFNDLSARHKQTITSQFTLGKNADRSGPIGPVVVTPDELDAANLQLTARVNGETVQSFNTRDMIHSPGKVIAYISDTVTLKPGDVIATGTGSGVGVGMVPPRFLGAGDKVEVEIEGIGVLTNPIVTRQEALR